jgi:hypothetical protein
MIATTRAEVIERLPFERYVEIDAEHSSSLRDMLVSPLLYRHNKTFKRPDADKLRLGRASHTSCIEPSRFLREYVLWETTHEDGKKRIRAGGAWEKFQADNASKTILTPTQYETAVKLRDILRDHPVAGPILREKGRGELTIVWTHPRTGLKIKVRVDWLTELVLADLKFTFDPSPRVFGASAVRFGYPFQLALYSDVVEAAGLGAPAVKIIAAQSKEPHDVIVFDLEHDVLEFGRKQYNDALDRVVECKKTKRYPGAAEDNALPLVLPAWATPSAEEELTFGGDAIF